MNTISRKKARNYYYSHEATLDRLAQEDQSLVSDFKLSIDSLYSKLYALFELGYFDSLLCALGMPVSSSPSYLAAGPARRGPSVASTMNGMPRSAFHTGAKHKFEVLEYLGDSVLQHKVSALLVQTKAFLRPHMLTKMRSSCVNNASLSHVYDALNLSTMFPTSSVAMTIDVTQSGESSEDEQDQTAAASPRSLPRVASAPTLSDHEDMALKSANSILPHISARDKKHQKAKADVIEALVGMMTELIEHDLRSASTLQSHVQMALDELISLIVYSGEAMFFTDLVHHKQIFELSGKHSTVDLRSMLITTEAEDKTRVKRPNDCSSSSKQTPSSSSSAKQQIDGKNNAAPVPSAGGQPKAVSSAKDPPTSSKDAKVVQSSGSQTSKCKPKVAKYELITDEPTTSCKQVGTEAKPTTSVPPTTAPAASQGSSSNQPVAIDHNGNGVSLAASLSSTVPVVARVSTAQPQSQFSGFVASRVFPILEPPQQSIGLLKPEHLKGHRLPETTSGKVVSCTKLYLFHEHKR